MKPFRVLHLGCRYLLAAVFLMAGASKLTDLAAFENYLLLHAGLPETPAWLVAHFLPWLELICGCCLALGYAVREAALLTALLLLVFLIHGLLRPTEVDCHCGLFPGLRPPAFWWWVPVRNALLLVPNLHIFWTRSAAPTDLSR